jgi:membrane protein
MDTTIRTEPLRRTNTLPRPRVLVLLRETLVLWHSRGAIQLAAALAFYALLSAAPVLIVLVAVLGLIVGDEAARGEIAPRLASLMGPSDAEAIELMIWRAGLPWGGGAATFLGLLTVFLGSSLAVSELRGALNTLWGLHGLNQLKRGVLGAIGGLLRERVFAFVMVLAAGLLVALSLVAMSAVAFAGQQLEARLNVPGVMLQAANLGLLWVVATAMVALVYARLPDARISRRDALVGAAFTAFLFVVGNAVVSQVFAVVATATPFGPAGSVLALLTWVYYSTLVFLFGAAFTAVFAERCGDGILPQRRWLRIPRPTRHRRLREQP